MIEVGALALISAGFAIVIPFLILIGIMYVQLNHRLDRIESVLDRVEAKVGSMSERVAVLEERGRATEVHA